MFVYLPQFRPAEIFSFSPTSSLYYFLSRSLAPTLPKNGCGHFLPAYRISGKVCLSLIVSPYISFHFTQGIIMGFPTTLSMTLVSTNLDPSLPQLRCAQGMVFGWAILSPLAKLEGWAPGPVGDMSTGSRGWILWVSLAIMCADSIVSLIPVVAEFITSGAQGWTSHEALAVTDDLEIETPERLVPLRWVLWGLGTSVVLGTLVLWTIFGNEVIEPWASLLGYAIGGLLSILA